MVNIIIFLPPQNSNARVTRRGGGGGDGGKGRGGGFGGPGRWVLSTSIYQTLNNKLHICYARSTSTKCTPFPYCAPLNILSYKLNYWQWVQWCAIPPAIPVVPDRLQLYIYIYLYMYIFINVCMYIHISHAMLGFTMMKSLRALLTENSLAELLAILCYRSGDARILYMRLYTCKYIRGEPYTYTIWDDLHALAYSLLFVATAGWAVN